MRLEGEMELRLRAGVRAGDPQSHQRWAAAAIEAVRKDTKEYNGHCWAWKLNTLILFKAGQGLQFFTPECLPRLAARALSTIEHSMLDCLEAEVITQVAPGTSTMPITDTVEESFNLDGWGGCVTASIFSREVNGRVEQVNLLRLSLPLDQGLGSALDASIRTFGQMAQIMVTQLRLQAEFSLLPERKESPRVSPREPITPVSTLAH
jgi:hypothetical protein